MRLHTVLTTAVSLAVLSISAPALAQSAIPAQDPVSSQDQPPTSGPMAAPVDPMAGDQDALPPAEGPVADVAASAGQPATIPLSSPTPAEQAYLLKAGDPNVVSNAPIPDTPETRAATGGPDSNGGRKTRAVGN